MHGNFELYPHNTVDGRNSAPVDVVEIPVSIGFYTSQDIPGVYIIGFLPSTESSMKFGLSALFELECLEIRVWDFPMFFEYLEV